MDTRINNRIIDLYNTLLDQTLINYNQTLNTINRIESGIRELSTNRNNRQENISEDNERNNYNSRNMPTGFMQHRYRGNNNNDTLRYTRNSNNRNPTISTNDRNNRQINHNNTSRNNVIRNSYRNANRNSSIFNELSPILTMFNNSYADLSPVIVRPSRRQINISTEIIHFSNDLQNNICPITQTPFEENHSIRRIRHCGHCFMSESLLNWFDRSVICPVCRYDIRTYNSNNYVNDNDDRHDNSNNNVTSNRNNSNDISNNNSTNNSTNNSNDISNNNSTNNSTNNSNLINSFLTSLASSLVSNNDISSNIFNLEYVIETPRDSVTFSNISSDEFRDNIFSSLSDSTYRNTNNNTTNYNDEDEDEDEDDVE